MWKIVEIIGVIFISSITFVPPLLNAVTDKTSTGYLFLASFFNPTIDGIALNLIYMTPNSITCPIDAHNTTDNIILSKFSITDNSIISSYLTSNNQVQIKPS